MRSILTPEMIKFIVVGLMNAAFTCLIFTALILMRVDYSISLSICWLCGILLTYCCNYLWVFKTDHQLKFRGNFARYFALYLFSFLVNLIMLHWVVQTTQANPILAQVGIMPFIVIMNYVTAKFWALKRRYE